MAEVNATRGTTTYDLTGLTTEEATILHALLGNHQGSGPVFPLFQSLDKELRQDPAFKRREVVCKEVVDYYGPTKPVPTYFTKEVD